MIALIFTPDLRDIGKVNTLKEKAEKAYLDEDYEAAAVLYEQLEMIMKCKMIKLH